MARWAVENDHGTRTYIWRGRGYPEAFLSVTSIIDLGVPKYLVPWAAKAVAELAYEDVKTHGAAALGEWERRGRAAVAESQAVGLLKSIKPEKLSPADFAKRWLKGAPDRTRDKAAQIGTRVHEAAEGYVLSLDEALRDTAQAYQAGETLPEWPDDIAGRMRSFVQFLERYRPVYEATEATVFSRSQQYAGTLDALMWLPVDGHRELVVVDYKSGRQVYPEVALQLAAYARGEFLGGPDGVTEIAYPGPVTRGAVLHLTDKGFDPARDFRWVDTSDEVARIFLHAREVARFQVEISKRVLGEVVGQDVEEALEASLERVAV